MKNRIIMKRFVMFFILLSLFSVMLNGQDKKSRKEKREKKEIEFVKTDSLINSKVFVFKASKANSTGGGQIDLTTHIAELIINKDSVESYLPYFGRAYRASYGGGSGIKFETVLTDYKVEKNSKKLNFIISFSAKTKDDNFQCSLSISYSGSATLSVNSNNRAFISYYGDIKSIKEK